MVDVQDVTNNLLLLKSYLPLVLSVCPSDKHERIESREEEALCPSDRPDKESVTRGSRYWTPQSGGIGERHRTSLGVTGCRKEIAKDRDNVTRMSRDVARMWSEDHATGVSASNMKQPFPGHMYIC